MSDAFYIAATGLQTQQLNVDTIANNLANLNTPAFKKTRVNFTDLVAADQSINTTTETTTLQRDAGPARSGMGVGVAGIARQFDSGALNATGSSWDLAIRGDGFLAVSLPDGTPAYTRGGTLKVNADGLLVTQSGQVLKPSIAVPANASAMTIDAEGNVLVSVPHQSRPVHAGQLQLTRFANPGALLAQGDGLYAETAGSGEAMAAVAGQNGTGSLQQGFLEASNVRMADEMVNLMVAQRAYEANAKVVQASDELLALVNNLRK